MNLVTSADKKGQISVWDFEDMEHLEAVGRNTSHEKRASLRRKNKGKKKGEVKNQIWGGVWTD